MSIYYITVFTLCIIISFISVKLVFNMIDLSNHKCSNYKGLLIPVSMGIAFIPVCIASSIVFAFEKLKFTDIFLILSLGMCALGVIDDFMGDKNVKGFKGHIVSLFHFRLTTGGFKATIGFLLALYASVLISKNFIDLIINTFLIALFANLFNLFDLRPGRALKFFFILFAVLIIINPDYAVYMFPLAAFSLVYFPYDIKAKAMLGDAGSNIIGSIVGLYAGISLPRSIKLVFLILLILIHIIAEKYSLTKIIEKMKILNYIDKIGRN